MESDVESPFIEFSNTIDKEALTQGYSLEWYYKKCYELQEMDPDYVTNLLIEDFNFREKFGLNVIASAEGEQGFSGKSIFFTFWSYKLGGIFDKPFDIHKNLYAIPEDFDNGIREADFRTTHFLDEQRNKNVGLGSASTGLAIQDYEEQCRYTQKNILYASPQVKDHSHYFIFSAQGIQRINNKDFCANCPLEIQKQCYKDKFSTTCPPEFRLLNRGKNIPFYQRSGYPKWLTFLLKTKRKMDGWEVPRGFVRVPMITPETLLVYDKIKQKNIKILESQKEDSFSYIQKEIDGFFDAYKDKLIKIVGGITERVFKIKDDQGEPKLHREKFDSRKYSVMNQKVIEAFLYQHLQSRRKYTVKEIDIMVSVTKEKLNRYVFKKNKEFFLKKAKGLAKE